jgi:hypothetical protein
LQLHKLKEQNPQPIPPASIYGGGGSGRGNAKAAAASCLQWLSPSILLLCFSEPRDIQI